MGNIGNPQRTIEFEPIEEPNYPEPVPAEPVVAPQEVPDKEEIPV